MPTVPVGWLQAQAGALWALLHPATVLVFVPLIPAAYMIFGILLSATMCAAKWVVLGCAKPCVHRWVSVPGPWTCAWMDTVTQESMTRAADS